MEKAVHKKATTAGKAREPQGRREGNARPLKGLKPGEQEQTDKPGETQSAENARFGQRFEVIIVRMIDDLSIIKSFIERIDGLERAETRAEYWMAEKDAPSSMAHGGALVFVNFKRLQAAETRQKLIYAEPGDQRNGGNEDYAAGEKMPRTGALQKNNRNQEKKFDAKTDDASARSGKEE